MGESSNDKALLVDTEGKIVSFDGPEIASDYAMYTRMKLMQKGYNIEGIETKVDSSFQIGQKIPDWEKYEIIPNG